MWLVHLLLLLFAIVVGLFALGFVLIAVAMVSGDELCPRCGLSLGVTDRDRYNRAYVDARFPGLNRFDYCLHCGWRRR